ncbi:sugar ABC transporter substrate-binding protein [Ahrensia kielensis]|uniref:Sugar ABC transporter substrate-binding protein n=1 Tax=Ahrensia kielensis TaxID=76980 RepID=A0ABU9T2R2_9HYPH
MQKTQRITPQLAVITKNRTNPAYIGARLGVDRICVELGANVTHYVPETPDDIDEQIALIHQAVASAPDAIVLAPTHATRLQPALDAILNAGIPMLYIVSETDPSPAHCFVGSDNYLLGRAMADRMASHIGGRGTVALMDGHINAVTSLPRAKGFRDALAENWPDVKIVFETRGDYQRDAAHAAFAAALPTLPDIDGLIIANDFMALGVMDAYREVGRAAPPMVGANVTPEGVELIKQGHMIASAAFDALAMGTLAAEGAIRLLQGEKLPKRIDLPAQLVDQSNLAEWDRPYTERTSISWADAVPHIVTFE